MRSQWVVRSDDDHLQKLLQQIHEISLYPQDVYEIAALLESNGWTDDRIQQQFGARDIFELSRQLWKIQQQRVDSRPNEYVPKPSAWGVFREGVRQFLRGMVFALPMVISVIAMLTLRFSLWSYQYLSVRTATAIAIGTILSFWSVGGFMQAIARRGFFYIYQGYYRMARRVTFRYIRTGVLTSVLVSLLLFWLNTLFPLLPNDMLLVTVLFYVVLNAIWLAVTVMYILQRELIFTGLIAFGILLVYIGFVKLHLNIIAAQLLAMAAVSVFGMIIVMYLFGKSTTAAEKGIRPHMPRPGVTMYSTLPYLTYGFFYFCLLFLDRLMAWSTYQPNVSYIIWFRGQYEVGLDFALVTLIIPLGVSEVIVSRIMNEALYSQRQYYASQSEELNRIYVRKYRKGILVMVVMSVLSAILVYLAVKWVLDHYLISLQGQISLTRVSNFVFIVGLVSYAILGVALVNAVTMFSLSRPELVVRPLLMSVAGNLVTGFLLSRWISYADAVWGIFAGSVIFAVLTTQNVFSVMRNFDYHLYLLS